MQRIAGHYTARSRDIKQLDHQISPQHFKLVDGHKLPIRGPFTQVICQRGTAVLSVSQPGEVPLYYSTSPGKISWHEQKLALSGSVERIPQGTAIVWTPQSLFEYPVDQLPRPEIRPPQPQSTAIAQYRQCILNACAVRTLKRVAIAQSGGTDSLLLAEALLRLGVEVVPMTICSGLDDLDIRAAQGSLQAMGLSTLPIVIPANHLPALIREALICLETVESSNVRMAIGNLLMARKCKQLGITMIFTGHGQDDVFGKGTLMKAVVAQQTGSPSEQWRDARIAGTAATAGMLKMFSATFRRYGVEVRHPYYDADLLEWAFAQSVETLPIEYKKQFVHAVARDALPNGFWLDEKHSIGYLSGSGLGLKQWLLKVRRPLFDEKALRRQLAQLRKLPPTQRAALCELTVDTPSAPAPSSS